LLCLFAIAGLLQPGFATRADDNDDRRVRMGARQFRFLIAADLALDRKVAADGKLHVQVYARDKRLADDVAELIDDLGGPVDLMGYSLGGMAALRTAIQYPDRVRRLVLVSVAARRGGSHPEVLQSMDAMQPEVAGPMKQSPVYELYARLAPRPEDWELLVARTCEFLKVDYDWSAGVAELRMPVLLVYADADSVTPAHIAEFYGLLGGGLRDANWDGSLRSRNQLAVLPGTTHYDIYRAEALPRTVLTFLT
jgi:pimeloyl-ACP methyl ester carboxylesterase